MGPGALDRVIKEINIQLDDRVIVPTDNFEDAAVLKNPEGMELIQSVDFFTPIVNDPFKFGEIAAANSLSDIYAMGGEPYSAMNIVCFPAKKMDTNVLVDILKGGYKKIKESGAVLAGGHTVEDDEIKYGLAVTGVIKKEHIAQNSKAAVGDILILTKPIGTGILATAVKAKWENHKELENEVYLWASRLNKYGAQAIRKFQIKGATDITGFGLGGHLLEMARASNREIELWSHKIPIMKMAYELASIGLVPEGSHLNKQFCKKHVEISPSIDPVLIDIIFDAQTSGGLVLSVPENIVQDVENFLKENGDLGSIIGVVKERKTEVYLRIK